MHSINLEKHNRETFRQILDALSMPGNSFRVEKLFDSYLLGVASVLLYSEVTYCNDTNQCFEVMDAITNSQKKSEYSHSDYYFCTSLDGVLSRLPKGTHLSPEQSTTVIFQTDTFEGTDLKLTGPGIDGSLVSSYPVRREFAEEFMNNNQNYPLGNEIYFLNSSTGEIKALSRTTKVEVI